MHAIAIDSNYGVPTVALHTHVFEKVVKTVTRIHGMPEARYAFVPQPVMGKTAQQLRAYVDGKDPLSGRPVMQEVIEGLTRPANGDRGKEITFDRSTPRWVEKDSEENLHRLFLDNNWTDKLPIILPTEKRVEEMLARTSHKPDEVVGHMRSSTTSSMAAMVVVNGPIRDEVKMNSGTGAMAPFNHANATIGRAYGLLSQNLQGGSLPGDSYMGSQGNNYMYNSVTFAENEERSPWEPFHLQHGFKATDSTVSVFTGCRSTAFTLGVREKYWREHVRNMLRGMDAHSAPTFLLDPIAARQFIDRGGFDTKEKFIQWIYENALMPAGEY